MNVYLAARYGRRRQMQGIARQIEALGHRVTSRWILGEHDSLDGAASPEQQRLWADEDMDDIDSADVLLTITEEPGAAGASRGGRHFEMGYARGRGLPVLMVGPTEHVFHHAAGVIQCISIADALDRLDRARRKSLAAMRRGNARMAREVEEAKTETNGGRPREAAPTGALLSREVEIEVGGSVYRGEIRSVSIKGSKP